MITINLISSRRAEQAKYRRLGEALIRATMLTGLVTATYLTLGAIGLQRMKMETEQTNLQKVAYRQQADEVHRLRDAQSALAPRVELVKTTRRRLDHWQYLYTQVARSIPATARLESINISPADATGSKTLEVSGRGDNAYVVSQMLLALNTQPGFSDVAMGPVNMSSPHEVQVNAKLAIKPIPEDAPAAPATPPTGPQ